MPKQPKPWSIYALMVLLLLLGLGGIAGGITLLADPSGELMDLPPNLLAGLLIPDYLWPGVFLIVGMGFGPYLVYYAVWQGLPWGRTAVIIQGFLLLGWILFQVILWGQPILIQVLYGFWGLTLVGLGLLPAVKAYFKPCDSMA